VADRYVKLYLQLGQKLAYSKPMTLLLQLQRLVGPGVTPAPQSTILGVRHWKQRAHTYHVSQDSSLGCHSQ